MFPFEIERIYLDEKAENDWVTQNVLKNLSDLPVERVTDKRSLIKQFLSLSDPIGTGKKNLLITPFYGKRLKPCPGTSNHICCGYHVVNTITNCPMDCSYCVLQGYLNNPFLTLYSNWEDLLEEIEAFLSSHPQSFLRLGTGELSDSLALGYGLSHLPNPYPFLCPEESCGLRIEDEISRSGPSSSSRSSKENDHFLVSQSAPND